MWDHLVALIPRRMLTLFKTTGHLIIVVTAVTVAGIVAALAAEYVARHKPDVWRLHGRFRAE
jgi:hypothetical protein